MVKLVVFGKTLDGTKEIEINVNKGFGMNCTIAFTNGKTQTCNNCTEFHHLFNSAHGGASAFESDIHGTGMTSQLNYITSITVELATELHDEY